MREIKRDSLVDTTDMLLYDIRELLIQIVNKEKKNIEIDNDPKVETNTNKKKR